MNRKFNIKSKKLLNCQNRVFEITYKLYII